jgi:hypothetical protein
LLELLKAVKKHFYQLQVDVKNRQIDALAYEISGLTEEEIAILEGEA